LKPPKESELKVILATIKVLSGSEEQFEVLATHLAAEVRRTEPGCLQYVVNRAEPPGTYIFIEMYRDQVALDAHRANAHSKENIEPLTKLFSSPPVVQVLDGI
jgi:quinol monooxygenase YgiN